MNKKKYACVNRRGWVPQDAFFSAKDRRFFTWRDMLGLIVPGFIIFWLWRQTSNLPGYSWNWATLCEFVIRKNQAGNFEAGMLLQGLFTTLRIGCWSFLFALLAGAIPGIFYAKKRGFSALPYRFFVNIIRNTPPLVLLFCIYFFAGNFLPITQMEEILRSLPESLQTAWGVLYAKSGQLDRMTAAVLALGLYQSAYMAEIIRGGVESVNSGQWDAAQALGFSRAQCLRYVILPQTRKIIIPPMTGQAITSFKDSALASLISLPDLTFQSLEIMAVSSMTFEVWTSCAILYLALGGLCAIIGRSLERKSAADFP